MESRIHREVYVRFGGRVSETCYSNMARHWLPTQRDLERHDRQGVPSGSAGDGGCVLLCGRHAGIAPERAGGDEDVPDCN